MIRLGRMIAFTKTLGLLPALFLLFLWMLCPLSCMGKDGEVLLSYLLNNRMTVILKGSYATDHPLDWSEMNNNQIYVDSDDSLGSLSHQARSSCDPYSDSNCVPSYDSLPIYLDFGGIRLSTKAQSLESINDIGDTEEFWDIASAQREVYCNQLYTDNRQLNTCHRNGGEGKFADFMNGKGAVYPSVDIPSAKYLHVGLYVRRLITGWAYRGTELIDNAIFDNVRVQGANIAFFAAHDPPSSSTDAPSSSFSQWFPLYYRAEDSDALDKGIAYSPVVLEIRFNMKENLMVHGYSFDSSTGLSSNKVIGFSDWRRDHRSDSTISSSNLGGNVLMRARFFHPHEVSRLDISNTSPMPAPTRHYYALYKSSQNDRTNNLPYAATPARSTTNQLNHISPASYELLCQADLNPVDGYPESNLGDPMPIVIDDHPQIMQISYPCPP